MKEIVVIGSGPAGLFGAIRAARAGCRVTVLECLPSPGRKLLASGAGKCNLTNILMPDDMIARFPAPQRNFIRPALHALTQSELRKFFSENGLPCKLTDGFHYFPATERAGDVLELLLARLRALGGSVVCNTAATALENDGQRITAVVAGRSRYRCDGVLAAGGGPGYPALGGRGSLYRVLEDAGHTVVPPVPALCGLPAEGLRELAGIVLPRVRLTLDRADRTEGILLFTHEGISGPAVLDLAGRVSRKVASGESVTLSGDLLPEHTREDWERFWLEKRRSGGAKRVKNLLAEKLPRALAEYLALRAGCADTVLPQLDAPRRKALDTLLTAFPFPVAAVPSWQGAMAADGGVTRAEVEPRTLKSRLFSNLAFAGEILDVDGPCGGFNLQWAFSSGFLAGKSVAEA